jgi:preprotein translocase subunit YajC
LQNGNEVLTTGGIIGTIVSIEDDRLVLRVKPNDIKIQISRSAISSLLSGETKSSEVKK